MKVRLPTVEADEKARRAVAHHFGHAGLATRDDIRGAILCLIDAWFQDLGHDLDIEEGEEQ